MTLEITRRRLHNQHLTGVRFQRPDEIVRWLGAVQAQEYLGALWALGLRLPGATEADIEQALADRRIVRLWFMRGTLHFLAAEDLRWMRGLIAPRVRRLIDGIGRYHKLELDESLFARSNAAIGTALHGGHALIRSELAAVLAQVGIAAEGLRLSLILQRAQADGLICYAARRGKQVAFALADEWIPPAPVLTRDAALAEFARRYFTSHGPATLQDFGMWSGLTAAEARDGLEAVAPHLEREALDGQTYWFLPDGTSAPEPLPRACLLPNFDEFTVGYKDRRALFDGQRGPLTNAQNSAALSNILLLDGRMVGTWKRTLKKNAVAVELAPDVPLGAEEAHLFTEAAERYGRFLGLPVRLSGPG